MPRIDFFIAGMQKAGTTALAAYLREQSGVQMSGRKEVHFFDDETIDWSSPSHDLLHAQFDWSETDVVRGEATPIYTYWPRALDRIRDYNQDTKLIVLLRHPSYRAFSHWRMETKRGSETLSFEAAISEEGRSRVATAPGGVHRVFSYIERGLYAEQIERLLSLFPRRNVLFALHEDLWSWPDEVIGSVKGFLGLEPVASVSRRYVAAVDSRGLGGMPDTARRYLDALFRDDILKTARLTGLDLSAWVSAGYREPLD